MEKVRVDRKKREKEKERMDFTYEYDISGYAFSILGKIGLPVKTLERKMSTKGEAYIQKAGGTFYVKDSVIKFVEGKRGRG